jgi:F-type H+-transporting ATPase subunit epsilon
MPALFRFSIVTQAALKFEGQTDAVVAPGAAGDLAALANHAPLLTTLRPGVVRASVVAGGQSKVGEARVGESTAGEATGSQWLDFAVDGGFMQVLPERVIILTDAALTRNEIDAEAARAELQRAEEALAQKRGADDSEERRAVAFAKAKLEVTHRPVV